MIIPQLVRELVKQHGAYLVGSAAEMLLFGRPGQPVDFDVIVPPAEWNKASYLWDNKTFLHFNKFGGLRFADGNTDVIDVWSMDLGEYYKQLPADYDGFAMGADGLFLQRHLYTQGNSHII